MRLLVLLLLVVSFSLVGVHNASADVITPTNVIITADDGTNLGEYFVTNVTEFLLVVSFFYGFWLGVCGLKLE